MKITVIDKKHRGYTLLFAVLTATLVLGVATFVVGVARKQYIISITARDSMFSFYSADSAISCVTQSWNYSTSTPTVKCAGADLGIGFAKETMVSGVPSIFHNGTTFYGDVHSTRASSVNGGFGIYADFGQYGCSLTQIWSGTNSSLNPATVIESRGYNVPCDTNGSGNKIPSQSRRNVERAIRVTQQ